MLEEVPPPGHLQVASSRGLEPVQDELESYSVCVTENERETAPRVGN